MEPSETPTKHSVDAKNANPSLGSFSSDVFTNTERFASDVFTNTGRFATAVGRAIPRRDSLLEESVQGARVHVTDKRAGAAEAIHDSLMASQQTLPDSGRAIPTHNSLFEDTSMHDSVVSTPWVGRASSDATNVSTVVHVGDGVVDGDDTMLADMRANVVDANGSEGVRRGHAGSNDVFLGMDDTGV